MAEEKERERLLMVPDGTIHGWNEHLAAEPGVKEVSEEQAYPERFVKGGKRKAAVDMTTEEPAGNDEANRKDGEMLGRKTAGKLDSGAGGKDIDKLSGSGRDPEIGKHGTTPLAGGSEKVK